MTNTKDMTAWEMARSIIAGLEKAIEQGKKEHAEKMAEFPGQPFKASMNAHLVADLKKAHQDLKADLAQHARASNLEL